MTSRRRRTRTSLTSVIVLLALAVGGYALHSTGVLLPGPDADAAPAATATVGAPTSALASASASAEPTISTGPTTGVGDGTDAGGASSPDAVAEAKRLLDTLPVKGKAPATGYDRVEQFGSAWLDVDHNGCDTRNDILARDLSDVVRKGPCTVTSGTLVSPYTGATVDFVRGQNTSTLVQIDHVVALENAWRTGAQQLTQAQRVALANDPDNLFAVDGRSNSQKRSGDAATWLPANRAFRCTYVEHQVSVKAEYGLWVVPAEREAVLRVLASC